MRWGRPNFFLYTKHAEWGTSNDTMNLYKKCDKVAMSMLWLEETERTEKEDWARLEKVAQEL